MGDAMTILIVLGLGCALVSVGALAKAWRHGVECDHHLRGQCHEHRE